jgi:XTP/dITP diphosphohydrolase
MLDLLFGTTNPGKLRELRRLVEGLPVRVLSPTDVGPDVPDVVEDGTTFHANAEKKASAFARWAGVHALADDSGLCVDALGGAPGVYSARWSALAPEPADGIATLAAVELSRAERDEANNDKLLAQLARVTDERRGAEYRAVLALAKPDGVVLVSVEGICRGRIGRARRGSGGFGYDPFFLVDEPVGAAAAEGARTMAELSAEEKDAISHRGRAFRTLLPVIRRVAEQGARF